MRSYQILAGFNRREPKALSLVWKKYFPEVFSSVRLLTNSSPDAEDLASDIIEKLLQVQTPFESMEKIRSYLYAATKNKCANHLNHLRIIEKKSEEIAQHYQNIKPEDGDDDESVAILRSRIKNAIDGLPRKCKRVFMLYYTRSLKNREIAQELGISEKSVEKHKTFAFKILRMEIRVKNGVIVSIIFL